MEAKMPALSKGLQYIRMEEEAPLNNTAKQGIVTILGSESEKNKNKKKGASLRRTLSADMSSKKWLEQNGFFSSMKKIASSEVFAIAGHDSSSSSSSSSEDEEEYEKRPVQDDIWRSMKSNKNETKTPTSSDVWGSILAQKSADLSNVVAPTPYVHPMVKRSASTLSEKSLEICTESLGSETGSDCFCSYPHSEIADDETQDKHTTQQRVIKESNPFEDVHVVKYKNAPSRPIPPPIPSISGADGASVQIRSHRENGRLVVEAVSMPPRNFFQAERHDGRLVLTLVSSPTPLESDHEYEEVFDNMEEVDQDVEEKLSDEDYEEEVEEEMDENFVQNNVTKKMELVVEENSRSLPSGGIIGVPKSAIMLKKLMGLGNKNPTWTNKAANLKEVVDELPVVPQSLPPLAPPRMARLLPPTPPPSSAASLNAYEYFWRNKTAYVNPLSSPQLIPLKSTHNNVPLVTPTAKAVGNEQQNLVVMKGNKAEYVVPLMKGCKESRRSLLIWEPYCIATS